MRKIFILVSILLLIVSCEKKTTVEGMVGQKIHLAPTVTAEADTAGCFFRWEFVEKPANSRLDVLNFQPNNRNYNIYFIPDAAGDFEVKCMIIERDGIVKKTQKFVCPVIEDTTGFEPESIDTADTAAIAPEYGDMEEDTVDTAMVEEKKVKEKKEVVQPEKPEEKPAKPEKEVAQKESKKVKGEPSLTKPVGDGFTYTIQIVARKDFESARKDIERLKELNLDVYLQKEKFKNTNETWYRVRVGRFDKYSEANRRAQELAQKVKQHGYENLWVDKLRNQE